VLGLSAVPEASGSPVAVAESVRASAGALIRLDGRRAPDLDSAIHTAVQESGEPARDLESGPGAA
jgi:hypothetical protein